MSISQYLIKDIKENNIVGATERLNTITDVNEVLSDNSTLLCHVKSVEMAKLLVDLGAKHMLLPPTSMNLIKYTTMGKWLLLANPMTIGIHAVAEYLLSMDSYFPYIYTKKGDLTYYCDLRIVLDKLGRMDSWKSIILKILDKYPIDEQNAILSTLNPEIKNKYLRTGPESVFYLHENLTEHPLTDQINSGSFGIAYAIDGNRILKVSKAPIQRTDITEISTNLSMDHPNIQKLTDINLSNGIVYLASNRANSDLYQYVSNNKLTDRQKVYVAYQLVLGLAYMTSRGFVHGDIKLENCIIFDRPNGIPLAQYIDFGNTIDMHCQASKRATIPGTISFNSINFFMKSHDDKFIFSYSDDVWSLGVTLYTLFYKVQFLPVKDHDDIYECITAILNAFGAVNEINYPGVTHLPGYLPNYSNPIARPTGLYMRHNTDLNLLLGRIFVYNPVQRVSVFDLLKDVFFIDIHTKQIMVSSMDTLYDFAIPKRQTCEEILASGILPRVDAPIRFKDTVLQVLDFLNYVVENHLGSPDQYHLEWFFLALVILEHFTQPDLDTIIACIILCTWYTGEYKLPGLTTIDLARYSDIKSGKQIDKKYHFGVVLKGINFNMRRTTPYTLLQTVGKEYRNMRFYGFMYLLFIIYPKTNLNNVFKMAIKIYNNNTDIKVHRDNISRIADNLLGPFKSYCRFDMV